MMCEYCQRSKPYFHNDCWWHEGGVLCQVPFTIEPMLKKYDEQCTILQCDGFTRIAHYILLNAGITHDVVSGHVFSPHHPTTELLYHWWIEVRPYYVVDYRLQMWLGPKAPHGVFIPTAKHEYQPFKIQAFKAGDKSEVCDETLFQILTFDSKALAI